MKVVVAPLVLDVDEPAQYLVALDPLVALGREPVEVERQRVGGDVGAERVTLGARHLAHEIEQVRRVLGDERVLGARDRAQLGDQERVPGGFEVGAARRHRRLERGVGHVEAQVGLRPGRTGGEDQRERGERGSHAPHGCPALRGARSWSAAALGTEARTRSERPRPFIRHTRSGGVTRALR